MNSPKIIVHCLVKNEENFIWYALTSVLPFADKILVWDNGSTDKTVDIVKSINSQKIELERHLTNSREEVANLRQKMLGKTPKNYDWLMILDGDEIWSKKSLEKVITFIKKHPSTETIVTKTYNLVGDIYHRLPNKFGGYTFLGKKGNYSLRFINLKTIPGLHVASPYGSEGYYDGNNLPIQYREGVKYINTEYFHATHLVRSKENKNVYDRTGKLKFYLGILNPKYKIPEVFFINKPKIVPDVTITLSIKSKIRSIIETIPRDLKNILFKK